MKNKIISHSEEKEWNRFLKKQFPLPVLVGEMSYYKDGILIVPKDDFFILNKKQEIIDTFTSEIYNDDGFSDDVLKFISKYKLMKCDIIGCDDLNNVKDELFVNFIDKYEDVKFEESSSLEYLKYKAQLIQ